MAEKDNGEGEGRFTYLEIKSNQVELVPKPK